MLIESYLLEQFEAVARCGTLFAFKGIRRTAYIAAVLKPFHEEAGG